jgi:glycosyltransferase involved in cell wall biosynthesis
LKKEPLISIITVVYNGVKTIEQTFKSVFNQGYNNIEYIVIDGGSTDGTIEIIEKYADQLAVWISEPDNGLYDAMNKGISLANGELIGMINSDDWYEAGSIEKVVTSFKLKPHKTIFHGDLRIHEENGDTSIKKFNPSLFKMKNYGVTYNHPTFFVTRDIYKNYKYNHELISVADIQFILEILLNEKDAFEYIPYVLANFRKGGISSQQTTFSSIKSGYIARKNAGFGFFENLFSIIIKLLYHTTGKFISVKKYNEIKKLTDKIYK